MPAGEDSWRIFSRSVRRGLSAYEQLYRPSGDHQLTAETIDETTYPRGERIHPNDVKRDHQTDHVPGLVPIEHVQRGDSHHPDHDRLTERHCRSPDGRMEVRGNETEVPEAGRSEGVRRPSGELQGLGTQEPMDGPACQDEQNTRKEIGAHVLRRAESFQQWPSYCERHDGSEDRTNRRRPHDRTDEYDSALQDPNCPSLNRYPVDCNLCHAEPGSATVLAQR